MSAGERSALLCPSSDRMEPSERVVTEHVLAYRECARTVWNTYFRHLPDGWHEFINVDHELFVGLVLVQSFDGYGFGSPGSGLVRLRPSFGPKGIEVLWARSEQEGRCWHWKARQLEPSQMELSFLKFFDWESEGIRDFRFVRARVVECIEAPDLIGADVLLPALECDFFVRP